MGDSMKWLKGEACCCLVFEQHCEHCKPKPMCKCPKCYTYFHKKPEVRYSDRKKTKIIDINKLF